MRDTQHWKKISYAVVLVLLGSSLLPMLGAQSSANTSVLSSNQKPQNANELSKNLDIEYKTIRYHLKVLEENGILTSVGGGYGKTYFPTETLETNKQYFVEIWDKIGKKSNKE